MRTIDPERVRSLLDEERERFVAEHPASVALAERAGRSLLNGVPMNWMTRWAGRRAGVRRPRRGAPGSPTWTAATTWTCASATPAP